MEQKEMGHSEEQWTLESYTENSYAVQCKSIYSEKIFK